MRMNFDPEFVRLALWALFAGACGLTLFLGGVLMYHWFQYAGKSAALAASVVYVAGSCACLAGIAMTILALI